MSDLTLVIIAWNNLFFVRRFVEQVRRLPNPILILDNASTYPPLLEYYAEIKKDLGDRINIWIMEKNYGHEVYKLLASSLPPVYLLSDPDLDLSPSLPLDIGAQLLAVSDKYQCGKVGLALDISDSEKFICGGYGELVAGIESGYYRWRLIDEEMSAKGAELYVAPTDTTFCLVNTRFPAERGLRVSGAAFTARHLPWYDGYLKANVPRDELAIWVSNNKSSSILQYVDAATFLT